MCRFGVVFSTLLGLMIGCALIGASWTGAQDFPYMVPQAPEFDESGNALLPGQPEAVEPSSRKRSRTRVDQPQPGPRTDYRTARPYVPQDPPAMEPPAGRGGMGIPAPTRPPNGPPPRGYTQPPSGPVQGLPDCSQFPMMIARSRSEPEMQAVARQYLTCLLKSGWNMEQARNQVIATIESTYKLAR